MISHQSVNLNLLVPSLRDHWQYNNIYTDQRGTVVLVTIFNECEQRHIRIIANCLMQEPITVVADGQ